jgi:hypothetical protein
LNQNPETLAHLALDIIWGIREVEARGILRKRTFAKLLVSILHI